MTTANINHTTAIGNGIARPGNGSAPETLVDRIGRPRHEHPPLSFANALDAARGRLAPSAVTKPARPPAGNGIGSETPERLRSDRPGLSSSAALALTLHLRTLYRSREDQRLKIEKALRRSTYGAVALPRRVDRVIEDAAHHELLNVAIRQIEVWMSGLQPTV